MPFLYLATTSNGYPVIPGVPSQNHSVSVFEWSLIGWLDAGGLQSFTSRPKAYSLVGRRSFDQHAFRGFPFIAARMTGLQSFTSGPNAFPAVGCHYL